MNSKEKLVNTIKKLIKKEREERIQVGIMTSENTLKIKDMEIDKSLLYFIETATVDINTKLNLVGVNAVGGAGDCRNCKYAESNANLEVSCSYDYSKSKNYIEDYYCKKNNSIVNSTSVCDK